MLLFLLLILILNVFDNKVNCFEKLVFFFDGVLVIQLDFFLTLVNFLTIELALLHLLHYKINFRMFLPLNDNLKVKPILNGLSNEENHQKKICYKIN